MLSVDLSALWSSIFELRRRCTELEREVEVLKQNAKERRSDPRDTPGWWDGWDAQSAD